ncbi:hypothetical protein A3D05_04245 [Candidatus Gottesmanbacteria bacterium RIFCSPHIGHO2_02_FULL_40_24]|uniref:Uncharacterized protein n=1 Tax=Candidatus Gottesmanbacteria bacterium RIFCSPHIGHO2_01_FULL_40_15 TaxID=1798376 RepID=A0A1F5Z0X2_9BACT|nr:MAG: hypothetical protein A2777_01035 [Candidatus Gottesmanbacteria bacterium RIFCSPHIGHO2_01_FULL_40_15]OGG17513.1 MAG: hypothetical protein A3D05_04245 [Candidatus Gottesmanbacteria bacterium RIFCSPHIGHO2_02_FULL_40_24]OGG23285.1 MAG: hypothetical protein A3B48_02645 [Candidatus Gottesmanbacteria bacterium RIFCSPLOWO2_01_FULL_40_10]OGG25156.1 MAG: hypothetical protein A3E42_01160 [Candidatus Gottesmanbacteria bacterium RIFCSPHIGHO2_12_FULL_40_13]OGG32725.1 MAG: hypothetical protein A3I80_0
MIIILILMFIVSFLLAIKEAKSELSIPEEIKKIKIRRKKPLSGVILFLKEKIIHYSSDSS